MAAAILWVGSPLSMRAEAMTSTAAGMRAAMDAINPVENEASAAISSARQIFRHAHPRSQRGEAAQSAGREATGFFVTIEPVSRTD
jgi:hypothetical protein